MSAKSSKKTPSLDNPYNAIKQLAKDLRDPNGGCPWDIEQSHQSILENLIEETYEAADAITDLKETNKQSYRNLKEELGDVLFQVVFHAQMAEEIGEFNLDDVVREAVEKLVYRHPHVYGDSTSNSSEEVLQDWETLKRREKKKTNKSQHLFSGIPKQLPALLKSYRMGQKASRVNFDWVDQYGISDILKKVNEEYQELLEELPKNPDEFKYAEKNPGIKEQKERASEELGDLLFVAAQLSRHYHIDPEYALQKANDKFKRRFESMEEIFKERLQNEDYPLVDEWNMAWKKVKEAEKK